MSGSTAAPGRADAVWDLLVRGLTLRGRSLVAAGASAAVCGAALGQRDLLRIAVLLLLLPLVSLALAARGRSQLIAVRTATPQRVPVGAPSRIRLDLSNPTRLPTGVLLAQDAVAAALGTAPRFVLDRLAPGRSAAVAYTVRPDVRGRHRVGPLQVRVTDPLGLCEVPAQLAGADDVLVLPRVEPLSGVDGARGWNGAGDAGERAAVATGEHGMGTREYRSGDDLRRVHWRSTARRGELMVRQDEQPRQQRATVLLDRRARAHRGTGPASSFERAVTAAASVASVLVASGYAVRLVGDATPGPWRQGRSADAAGLLDVLADVAVSRSNDLGPALAAVGSGGDPGLVVAVLGRVSPEDVTQMAQVPRRGGAALALLVEPAARSADAALERTGWTVVDVRPGEDLAAAWDRLRVRAAA